MDRNYTKSQAENSIQSPLTTHNCLAFTTAIIFTYMNTILTYVMPHFSPLLFMLEVGSGTLGTLASDSFMVLYNKNYHVYRTFISLVHISSSFLWTCWGYCSNIWLFWHSSLTLQPYTLHPTINLGNFLAPYSHLSLGHPAFLLPSNLHSMLLLAFYFNSI